MNPTAHSLNLREWKILGLGHRFVIGPWQRARTTKEVIVENNIFGALQITLGSFNVLTLRFIYILPL